MGAVERPARPDLGRLGAGIGYRETGDPFAGEVGLPNPRTGQCAPREAGALGVLIARLGAALGAAWARRVSALRAPRPAGRSRRSPAGPAGCA